MKRFQQWIHKIRPGENARPLTRTWGAGSGSRRFQWPAARQWGGLFQIFSRTERRFFWGLVLIFVISLSTLGVRLYQRSTVLIPEAGGEYVEGVVGNPTYINPVLAQSNDADLDISRLVFSGLFTHDAAGETVPDMATGYELSEDQKVYTIHLREGITWHDGQPLTSNDVLSTIGFIQDSTIKSPLAGNLRGVTASAPDDLTVVLTLTEPFAPFLSSLTFGILPAHIWNEIPLQSFHLAETNLKPIGTGAYKFHELKKDRRGNIKSYTLVRNEGFYDRAAYIKKITFKFYPDLESLVEAGRKKQVEGLGYVPKESKESLAKNKQIINRLLRLPQYTAVFLNQKNTLLSKPEVKQALAHSINKQGVIDEVLNGEGEAIDGPILPGYVGYNPEIRKYEFDPVRAMEILDEAGWTMAEGEELRTKDGQELQFTLTTIDQPDFVASANMLKDFWQKIGVGVVIQIIDPNRIQRYVIKPRDFEALLVGEIVGTDPDPYPFWHSSQGRDPGLNLSVFVNKDVDQLLEEARKITDLEQRRIKYLHFQNIIADELPALFLYNPTYTYGLPEKIQGFEQERITVPSDRFVNITNWYINTKRVRE
ncbi:MAG: ABC transporter substrate-binding protein [bacterium]|nr:ABC transporter substrate-binding protein [bacterium]